MTRPLLLAVLLWLSSAASVAVAGAPVPGGPLPVEITTTQPKLVAHLQTHGPALQTCALTAKPSLLRVKVRLAWNRGQRTYGVAVSGGGGTFNRCAAKALRGTLVGGGTRSGSGRATLVLRRGAIAPARPVPIPMTPPSSSPATALDSCRVDTDCTVHFRMYACVNSDPIAVSSKDPAAVRAAYPVRRLDCGMGGPQWEAARDAADRWSARCEVNRCVLVEGPVPASLHP